MMSDQLEGWSADLVFAYSRQQAIEDGVLVDLSPWANPHTGMLGGFTLPVAVTASVWADVQVPACLEGIQDLRGRAHDLLWMAHLATQRATDLSVVLFQVILDTGAGEALRTYKLVCGPDDDLSPCLTIMQVDED